MRPAVDTDILVVGAGPTGLMLANQLARRGVRTMIMDRHAGPARETRALGVQARTLEIYGKLGIVERALELGKRASGANLWAQGKRAARIPLGDIGRDLSPYPFLLILGQDDNERLLGDTLQKSGVSVQWNTELVGLVQHPEHVTATLKHSDGTLRDIVASWVGGCDGAHSAVRELSGIEFQGAPYEHVFFIADTQATGPMVPDELNVYLWRSGFHLFFPMRGTDHWRVVGIVPPTLRERANLAFEHVVPSIRGQAGKGLQFQRCTWFSTYRIHHRRAARFRDRRCFLLGDAAHIHSPVGAQGMNTGLQDAYNLGWKLALVASARANATLLDSYEEERIPVAERLLSTTDRAFSLIVSESWLAGIFRTRVLARIAAFAMTRERIRKFAFRTISQTGIQYRASALSQMSLSMPPGAPQAGDRFPWLRLKLVGNATPQDLFEYLDDTRFNLIVIGQALLTGFSVMEDVLRAHVIPDDPVNDREFVRVHMQKPAFYLLRPDGHIGLAGTYLDAGEVKRYLSERLYLRELAA